MRAIGTIAGREFLALVTAPIGYVVMMFFLFIAGLFFVAPVEANVGTLSVVVGNTTIWLVFLLPALTMRLLAEEKKQGTIELLMTSPVTETQVVIGKYLGVLAYYVLILFSMLQFVLMLGLIRSKAGTNPWFPTNAGLILNAATLVMVTVAALRESRRLGLVAALLGVGSIVCAGFAAATQMGEWGPTATGFLGLFLLGATFLAIGLMTSGLTRNQIISWVSTAAVLLALTVLISWITRNIPPTKPELLANPGPADYLGYGLGWVLWALVVILQTISLQAPLEHFSQGVLDLSDFVLYLSLIVVSLYFAIRGLTTSRAA